MELTLTRPDDWHLHVRDADALGEVVPHTAQQFGRAIIMPNLQPPVTTTRQAIAYREHILAAVPEGVRFTPLMTLYLTGPTTATAVLLPMRIYIGFIWMQAGLAKLSEGWFSLENEYLPRLLAKQYPPEWFNVPFISAAAENVFLFQYLFVIFQLIFGVLMIGGGVTRVTGTVLGVMSLLAWVASGYAAGSEHIPMAIMSATLAVAAAGRYLGIDAILRARTVRIPLF